MTQGKIRPSAKSMDSKGIRRTHHVDPDFTAAEGLLPGSSKTSQLAKEKLAMQGTQGLITQLVEKLASQKVEKKKQRVN